MNILPAWIRETIHRLLTEAVRVWILGNRIEGNGIPTEGVFYVYPSGPVSIDWGDQLRETHKEYHPLRGKRIVVTLRVEEQARLNHG